MNVWAPTLANGLRAVVLAALVCSLLVTLPAKAQDPSSEPVAEEAGPPCGPAPVSIARMQWPSAAILAHIHALIITQEFGCAVQIVAGDLGATSSSMATTGRPMVAPELWLGRVAAIWNSALEAQRVRPAAPTFSGGPMEAWFVPDYVRENNPELLAAANLSAHWQVFVEEGDRRATFVSCPADWACALINRNLFAALGLTGRFEIIEPTSRFELDERIAGAVSRREPILFYYWQPNAILDQLNFVPLDMGAYDANAIACLARRDCPSPTPSAFGEERVVVAVSEDLYEVAPDVAAYFQRATLPLEEMNALLAFQSEGGGTAEDAAWRFVDTRREVWERWLGE